MTARLALRSGVVWICRSAGVARLVPYDLGGRRLGRGFVIAGTGARQADIRGIAVDEDRRVWAADAGSGSVRAFTAFGTECAGIAARDGPESVADAGGIAAQGTESELRILVSRRGERRHALLLVDPQSGSTHSLRPGGDPSGTFGNLAGVALAGRMAFACEAGRGVLQAFRDGEFHYRIAWHPGWSPGSRATGGAGARFEPRAVAVTADGRTIVAGGVAGRVAETGVLLLFDAGGSLVRRLDAEREGEEEALGDDVSGVVVDEGGSERGSMVLTLDRGGYRVLAFGLDGRFLGAFHDLEVESAGTEVPERETSERVDARAGARPHLG